MIRALEYIKYQWIAKGRHGIHSPFVYDYVDTCLQIPISDVDNEQIHRLTKDLALDNTIITTQDFGAGSKTMGDERKISSILKNSSSKGKYGKLLFQLARHYKPKKILEFGTSLGVGSTYMMLGNPLAEVTTIEACSQTRERAMQHLGERPLLNSVHSTFNEFLDSYSGESYDLVFVDGHHDGGALLSYMERLKPITHDDTIFVLDDIRWSNSMHQAWIKIVTDIDYHLTLDHFRMGIAIRRSLQEKEHFVLKL